MITLRTFTTVKGLPIYDAPNGQVLGSVLDLCFTEQGIICGLLMDCNGLFKRGRVIPITAISAIGSDGVMVSDKSQIRLKEKTDTVLQHNHHGLIGKPLLTNEGQKLGLIEDVYFQENVGTIVGYEVTDGFFADMTEGRKVIKTTNPNVTIGEHAIVVSLNEQ